MRDDFDPVVADRFDLLDQVPIPDTWTRVLSRLDHMPIQVTGDERTMVDLEAPSHSDEPRKRPGSAFVALALAAAGIVAIALVAIRQDDSVSPADQPSPTLTVAPTVPPQATTALPESHPLAPGTYTLAKPEGSIADYTRVIVTLPAGWAMSNGLIHKRLDQDDEVAFSVWTVDQVYDDPCNWQESSFSELDLADQLVQESFHDVGTGSTVRKPVVGGLANQFGRHASELTRVELGGEPALKIELAVPAQLDLATCDQGQFRSWTGWSATGDANTHHSPGQIDVVYMVDVDRRALVIDASHMPAASAADLAELDAILASMIIDRGP